MKRHIRIFSLSCAALLAASLLAPGASAKRFSMSYLYFGSPSAYAERVRLTQNSLDEVSPNYFNLDGGSLRFTGEDAASFVAQMHRQGVRVVPFLSNHWDRELGVQALENRHALAEQLAQAVERYNLDGVNIDIENVTHRERDAYSEFVELVRQKLPAGKTVAVAVAANPNGYTQGWHGSYDYRRLGESADYLMLMTYDEHYQGGPAGPVASLSFMERSVQYALEYVSPDKLVLGLPFFGRIWSDSGTLMQGRGLSEVQIAELIVLCGGSVHQDASGSAYAKITVTASGPKPAVGGVTLTPGSYTIWYEPEASKKRQLSLVEQYNLRGAGSWSLGQGHAGTWVFYSLWLNGWTFADAQGHWAVPYILEAAENGTMTGLSDSAFGPDAPLTRGEAAVVLCRLAGLSPENTGFSFSDLQGHWAAGYVEAAFRKGLVSGTGGSLYAPDRPVSRQEIAVMLAQTAALPGASQSAPSFPDLDPERHAWSYDAILRLARAGVLLGFPDGTFRPEAPVSRGELAVMLSRLS